MNNKSNDALSIDVNAKKFQLQAQTYLKTELGMDDEQVLGILKTLSAPLKATLHSVEEAYKEKNLKEIAETAHSLKGALLNLGLNELVEVAKAIEQSAKTATTTKEKQLKQKLVYLHTALQHF